MIIGFKDVEGVSDVLASAPNELGRQVAEAGPKEEEKQQADATLRAFFAKCDRDKSGDRQPPGIQPWYMGFTRCVQIVGFAGEAGRQCFE